MVIVFDKNEIYFANVVEYRTPQNSAHLRSVDISIKSEENLDIWHPNEGMLIYVDSEYARITDIARYELKVPTELNYDTLKTLYEEMVKLIKKHGYSAHKNCYPFDIIITDGKTVYEISGRGYIKSLHPTNTMATFFEGEGAACYGVDASHSPKERVAEFYERMSEYYNRTVNDVVMLSTANNEMIFVKKSK
jgi:hypothetical protein